MTIGRYYEDRDLLSFLDTLEELDIKLINRSWYMEGYHDREFNKEPIWIIKTGKGGPRYEGNPKYGQHIEKQDYSGLNDFERAIHRGFLCAGVVNVPVNIIKETAQDCLAHLPVEWSEEDEEMLEYIIGDVNDVMQLYTTRAGKDMANKEIAWLKSLKNRGNFPKSNTNSPSWSEEDEE